MCPKLSDTFLAKILRIDFSHKNSKEIVEWEEADEQARKTIEISVEDDELVHIRIKKTAKDA